MKRILTIFITLFIITAYSCDKKEKENLETYKIILNTESINLVKGGDNYQLEAYQLPKMTKTTDIKWSSSDEKIATVTSKGIITPIAEGKATIKAIDKNKIESHCIVNVNKNNILTKELNIKESTEEGLVIKVDETKNLTLLKKPENSNSTITWTSSNTNIATINNGVLTGKKSGKVTIIAKTKDYVKAKCIVIVSDKEISAESIKISKENVEIKEGEKKVLNAIILPENTTNQKVVWSSSDSKIASVVKTGQVSALKGGNVKITATSSNGLKAVCNVTIIPIIWATEIQIQGKSEMPEEGEQVLSYTMIPKNAENEDFVFSSSNEDVASVNQDGKVIALKPGKTVISLSTNNDVKGTLEITVLKGSDPLVYEGRTYKTVEINGKIWMSQNFAYLPKVNTLDESSKEEDRVYVYNYNGNDVEAAKKTNEYNVYGALYNYAAAVKYCPKGWHLASHEEWKEVEKFFGMSEADLDKDTYTGRGDIGHKFRSTKIWDTAGTNDSGLNILPGGYMSPGFSKYPSKFTQEKSFAKIWTSTPSPGLSSYAYCRGFSDYRETIVANTCGKDNGFSVRYVKD